MSIIGASQIGKWKQHLGPNKVRKLISTSLDNHSVQIFYHNTLSRILLETHMSVFSTFQPLVGTRGSHLLAQCQHQETLEGKCRLQRRNRHLKSAYAPHESRESSPGSHRTRTAEYRVPDLLTLPIQYPSELHYWPNSRDGCIYR